MTALHPFNTTFEWHCAPPISGCEAPDHVTPASDGRRQYEVLRGGEALATPSR